MGKPCVHCGFSPVAIPPDGSTDAIPPPSTTMYGDAEFLEIQQHGCRHAVLHSHGIEKSPEIQEYGRCPATLHSHGNEESPEIQEYGRHTAPPPSTATGMRNLRKSKSTDVALSPFTAMGMRNLQKSEVGQKKMTRPPPLLTRPTPSPAPPARPIPPARLENAPHGAMGEAGVDLT
jgi:hypothetical protein